jgi:membrane associated rhomboid family serine protease
MKYLRNSRRGLFENFSVTAWLIFFNIIISVTAFIFFYIDEKYVDYFALNAVNFFNGNYLWTIFVHMFVHGSFLHLIVNMMVLFSLGGLCEKIIGRKRFLWFYLISGLFAGLLSVYLSYFFGFGFGERIFGNPLIPMVGASGAIFAIAGLYVLLLPNLRFGILFIPFFSLPAYIMIPGVLFLFWGLSIVFNWSFGNVAHFGGFLVGIFYGFYLRNKYKRKVTLLRRIIR